MIFVISNNEDQYEKFCKQINADPRRYNVRRIRPESVYLMYGYGRYTSQVIFLENVSRNLDVSFLTYIMSYADKRKWYCVWIDDLNYDYPEVFYDVTKKNSSPFTLFMRWMDEL